MSTTTSTTARAATPTAAHAGPTATGLPLTAAQTGMYYAQALDPGSPAQNTAECLAIDGPLDPHLFHAALRRVTAETDSLRLRFTETPEGPRQHLAAEVEPPLLVRDFRDDGGEDAARARLRADLADPFDLATGPLFRHALLRVGEERWLWYQCVHHLVMDGYGYSLLVRRTAEVYSALAAGEEPAPRAFGTLAELLALDEEYRTGPDRDTDRAYWTGAFADRPEAPLLAGRSALPSRTFLRRTAHLTPEDTARLHALARALKATWPDILLAAQALHVSRTTAREDVVLGLPLMGRLGSAALRVPGMVMNVVPLRLRVDPAESFARLVRRVVTGVREARRHQRYRYEDLRRDLGLLGAGRALTGPLVNVMPFDYGATFAGAPARAENLSAGPVDDLSVHVYDRADGRGLRIDHDANPALHDETALAAHQDRFLALLRRLATSDPETPTAHHPLATDEELRLVLDEFNATERALPPTTLIGPIEARAAHTPDAPALVLGDTVLSYAELTARANRLAHHLTTLGAAPGATVAVSLPRSVDLVVALVAVLKTGAAYLPLDPEYPAERLEFMLADAAPVCALTDTDGRLPRNAPVPVLPLDTLDTRAYPAYDPPRALTRHHPAYVLYTSGSTGRPKGVVVSHAAIDNRLRWMQGTYPLAPGDRVLQKTPSSFDVSVWEFFWPLREGATLVLAEPGAHKDPRRIGELITQHAVNVCHFVPSMLQAFLAGGEPARCVSLRDVFASGEALSRESADTFARVLPGARLHNLYGPTEAAVDVTHHTCVPGDAGPVALGRPVWNTRLYVLDAAGQPCPPGVPGELHLAGRQLADGYLARPELTAARFPVDPYGPPGTRMYRTGDLAQWTPEGEILYLGRTDHQVKLRGQRIELGEIEAALSALPGVDGACALVREDTPGDQRLIGYVTGGADPAALRTALGRTLPAHMVPAAVLRVDAFPLGPAGKLDRKALPAPVFTGSGAERAPASPEEDTLVRLFREVLRVPDAGPDDAFFDLGGSSLLAVRLVGRIRDELGVEPTLGSLFESPTPAALAARLTATGPLSRAALSTVLPLRASGEGPALFAIHPAGGLAWCYAALATLLGPGQRLYGIQARGLDGPAPLPVSLEEEAADYVREIRALQPHGPYRLLGWSVGGVLAHTVATLLQEAGEKVDLLALLDAFPAEQWRDNPAPEEGDALTAVLRMAGIERTGERTKEDVMATLAQGGSPLAGLADDTLARIVDVVPNHARLMRAHTHRRPFEGNVLFFTAATPRPQHWLHHTAWRPHVHGTIENHDLPCTHPQLLTAEPLETIAETLRGRLEELRG
ncbi:amino acid adenylation domain-containing protein [Streptomyces sp. NPDC060243]|uniref:amino acid adenylation domain-containing protein n=1 Tax=Streptomyces sp. NPDC060243 TaxID=3347081 RepID=UPI003651AFCC